MKNYDLALEVQRGLGSLRNALVRRFPDLAKKLDIHEDPMGPPGFPPLSPAPLSPSGSYGGTMQARVSKDSVDGYDKRVR